ncbi:MAG: nucleotidyltransferase family protein [bacterium]|nr:nucleotidyltransferase family protein [bacterium]
MDIFNKQAHHWLTPYQELLLRAIFLQKEDGLQAWEQWISRVDIDTLDSDSYQLLPQLYQNLNRYGIEHPAIPRMKGMYRYTWSKNQQLIYQVAPLLEMLYETGIRPLLLGDAVMAANYYNDYGLRRIDSIEFYVPESQVVATIGQCKEVCWIPVKPIPEASFVYYVSNHHRCRFNNESGQSCILHWRLFPPYLHMRSEDIFWNDAVPLIQKNVQGSTLNSADQLLYLSIHGIALKRLPSLQWIADMMTILHAAQGEIDWQRLLIQAERLHMVLSMRMGLSYLHETFDAPIPLHILRRFKLLPVSSIEHTRLTIMLSSHSRRLLSIIGAYMGNCILLSVSGGNCRIYRSIFDKIGIYSRYGSCPGISQRKRCKLSGEEVYSATRYFHEIL